MKVNYILFNALSSNSGNQEKIDEYIASLGEDAKIEKLNVVELTDYKEFFAKVDETDTIHLLGGDGTLNHFINDTHGLELPCDVYLCGAGSGNDFLNDVADKVENGRVLLNPYLGYLPKVFVKDQERFFINGVGYGIDGYCCEKADEIAASKSNKKINYTSIAINGLLFHYDIPNAKVKVDGVEKEYKRVYLAPTMFGRYYGGGMQVAPAQERLSDSHEVSLVVMHGMGRLKALIIFPSIFKGEHIKKTKNVEVITGHEIEVEFDKPTALQIDGETVRGVTSYKVVSK